jgi:hypothetical protein
MAVWPPTLPQSPMIEGYTESAPEGLLRTQMETGPAKLRRRYTSAPRRFMLRVALTKAQVETLDSFFVNTCALGALDFDWTHPRTGSAVTYRWVSKPGYRPDAGDPNTWYADLDLEVMP